MTLRTGLTAPKKRVRWRIRWQTRRPRDGCSSLPMTTCVWLRGRRHEQRASCLDQREEANPLQRGWVGADGNRVLPKLFWSAMPQLPLSGKNWSEHERAEIGRLEAVCSETNHWSLDCDHTDAGNPWCVIYDHQHHRIVLHIARIERRYVVVWPREGRSAETPNMTAAVEMALERLRAYAPRPFAIAGADRAERGRGAGVAAMHSEGTRHARKP